MDSITWEFYVDEAGEHRCRTRASNGNILMVSGEGYVDKRDAENCARLHGWDEEAAEEAAAEAEEEAEAEAEEEAEAEAEEEAEAEAEEAAEAEAEEAEEAEAEAEAEENDDEDE